MNGLPDGDAPEGHQAGGPGEGDFWEDGACLVRRAVTPAELDAARTAVDAMAGTDELADLSALAGDDGAARFRAGVDHWRTHDDLRLLATTGSIPRAVAGILGTPRLWLYEDSVLVKDAGSTVPTRWHTDEGYFHAEGRQMATVWLALDPAPRSSGALRFARRSHLLDVRFRPTLFVIDDPIGGTEGEAPPVLDLDDPSVVGWDLLAGDLTVHHARTLHAAEGNSTGTARRALSIRYCGVDAVVRHKPGVPPKPGFDAVADGTSIADVADALGLPEADLSA